MAKSAVLIPSGLQTTVGAKKVDKERWAKFLLEKLTSDIEITILNNIKNLFNMDDRFLRRVEPEMVAHTTWNALEKYEPLWFARAYPETYNGKRFIQYLARMEINGVPCAAYKSCFVRNTKYHVVLLEKALYKTCDVTSQIPKTLEALSCPQRDLPLMINPEDKMVASIVNARLAKEI